MAGTPTYAVSSHFLGVSRADREAAYVVAGIPMDISRAHGSFASKNGPKYCSIAGHRKISERLLWHARKGVEEIFLARLIPVVIEESPELSLAQFPARIGDGLHQLLQVQLGG